MKGRSPSNIPGVKKKDLHNLLLELGGEARWKDLKNNARITLHWGPTTLKQTLDQMVREKTIDKEARLGTKGPEVWYKTIIPLEEYSLENTIAMIREEAGKLKGKEKELFLRHWLYTIIYEVAARIHTMSFLIVLGTAEVRKASKAETLLSFNQVFDHLIRLPDNLLLEFLYDHRIYAMETIDQILREPHKGPSVRPRSIEDSLGSSDSFKKWIKEPTLTELKKRAGS